MVFFHFSFIVAIPYLGLARNHFQVLFWTYDETIHRF